MRMFLFTGALFVLCGLLLLAKARRMTQSRGISVVAGLCAAGLALLGLRLILYAFTTF